MTDLQTYDLSIDLRNGVVPISKAASALAALIKRAKTERRPVVVTQKGYPTGVIIDTELYTALVELVQRADVEGSGGVRAAPSQDGPRSYPTPADLAEGRSVPEGWRPDGVVLRRGEAHEVRVVKEEEGELFVSGLTFAGWIRSEELIRAA